MAYFDGFGSGSFPSLSGLGGGSSFSLPSTPSWGSGVDWGSGLSGGITGGAGQGGFSLPSWGGSSGFPSLGAGRGSSQGMGGNDYPAPSSFFGGGYPASSGGFQPGGILGGAGQSAYPSLGSLFGGGAASGGGLTPAAQSQFGQGSPLSGYFNGGGAAGGGGFQPGGILGGQGQGAQTPLSTNTPLAGLFGGGAAGGGGQAGGGFQMPGGFAGGIFGVNQNAQSPSYTSGGSAPQGSAPYNAQNGGIKASPPPSQTPSGGNPDGSNGRDPHNRPNVNQGGVTYLPLVGSNYTPSSDPPKLGTGVVGSGSNKFTDQYGRTYYTNTNNDQGGDVVGVSANGTVLKRVKGGDQIYDTGATAYTPAQPKPQQSQQQPSTTVSTQPQSKNPPLGGAWIDPNRAKDDEKSRREGTYLQ